MATKTIKVKTIEECDACSGKGYTVEEGKGIEGFHRCPVCRGDRVLKATATRTITVDDEEVEDAGDNGQS